MKKLVLCFAIAILMIPVAMMGQCGTSNLTADDGTNTYQTAPIGPHCWTTTNFRATNYYDGTEIPNTLIYKSEMYPDEAANLENYGRLYTWYAAMKVAEGTTTPVTPGKHGFVQGVCPDGWHLPLEVEVAQLSNYDAVALHSENPIHWLLTGTNETGQNMLPGGFYSSTLDRYENLRGESYIWTASSLSPTTPMVIWSDCHCSMCVIKDAVAANAMSVRCVYDIYQPQVVTDAWSVEEVDDNEVLYFNGNITFAGYDEDFVRGFQYGTDPADLSDDWNEAATSEGTFRMAIENLNQGTTYFYRAYVTNEFGTVYGVVKSFTTLDELPAVTTDSVSAVTISSAKLHGTVTSMGDYTTASVGFKYGTSETAMNTVKAMDENSAEPYDIAATDLLSNTTYYYQAFAAENIDTVYGAVKSFTTLQKLPAVTTDSVSAVTISSAKLHGTVTSMGDYTTASVGFKYGTSETAMNTVKSMDKNSAEPYDIAVTELLSNTTYYYQAFAAENIDTVYGAVKSFTTLSELPAVTTDSASAVTISSAKLHGTVTSMGDYPTASVGFKYGTSETAMNTVKSMDKNSAEPYDIAVTELLSNTTYYYQAFAAENIDTVYGAVKSFTTTTVATLTCGDSISDVNGNRYATVAIGTQCWTAQNLRTTAGLTENSDYWHVNGQDTNDVKYGLLYNWNATTGGTSSSAVPSGVQGICPVGWHVPSNAEWNALTTYVGEQVAYQCGEANTNIAKALASTTGWRNSSVTCAVGNDKFLNNATGFNVLPASLYDYNRENDFYDFNFYALLWSATAFGDLAGYRQLSYNDAAVYGAGKIYNKNYGFSVRCVFDEAIPEAPVHFLPMSVATDSARTSTTMDQISLYGTVTYLGGNASVTAGFKYGTSETAMNSVTSRTVTTTGSFHLDMTNIVANTIYYYQAFTAADNDTVWGAMKKFMASTVATLTCGDSISDVQGNHYATVAIGTQCWLAQNLRTTVGLTENSDYWHANGQDTNDVKYGLLYNWNAATGGTSSSAVPSDVQGVCPPGWHVPSNAEWNALTSYVSSQATYQCDDTVSHIAKALSSATGWRNDTTACAVGNDKSLNNATGFNLLPASLYDYQKETPFYNFNFCAYLWSSTGHGDNADYRQLSYRKANVRGENKVFNKNYGFSVRCLQD